MTAAALDSEQLMSECDPRLDSRVVRYQLDSAHNRRRFLAHGVTIAAGGRDFFPLPIESRETIFARPALHPFEPDAADRARAQVAAFILACIDAAEWAWAHRSRVLLRLHRALWRRDTRVRVNAQLLILGAVLGSVIFALFHHGK